MWHKVIASVFVVTIVLAAGQPVKAQDGQGLGPGLLSLDSTVGKLDSAIQKGKSK
ncbi:MAG: hypothetical protein GTO40_14855, partial [Deltaproteobacteria bacterium]|nr:hypothetical protein [Deltaproteobacteria bacterium]